MAEETLKLTQAHRIAALERDNVVLRDKMRILHGMVKQQRQLINEYITQQILAVDGDGIRQGHLSRRVLSAFVFLRGGIWTRRLGLLLALRPAGPAGYSDDE